MSANNLSSASPSGTFAQLLHIGTGNLTSGVSILLGDGTSTPLFLGTSECQFFSGNAGGSIRIHPYMLAIGRDMTASHDSYVDLHACSGSNYSFRMFRSSGSNGGAGFVCRGTGNVVFYSSSEDGVTITPLLTITSSQHLLPGAAGTSDLGWSGGVWHGIYLSNAPTVTSDARLKQQVRPLSAAETAVAQSLKPLLRAYQMISDVEAHGESAKIRIGILAQDVVAAFAAQGLDSCHYSMVHYEYDSYSIRYEELLAFMIAAL